MVDDGNGVLDSGVPTQLGSEFLNTLNRHGHAFHGAVWSKISDLHWSEGLPFVVEAGEFPVEVQGVSTRIDLVLRRRPDHFYIVCECKRVNPALANWCFVKMPFPLDAITDGYDVVIETIRRDISAVHVEGMRTFPTKDAFHVGFEVKTQVRGDSAGPRNTIEEAATQVSRAANGFANFFLRRPKDIPLRETVRIVPMIITTADLWVSDLDVRVTDLSSGEIRHADHKLRRVDHLWFQYHVSPTLKHARWAVRHDKYLDYVLEREFLRSIAVVNPRGLDRFLRAAVHMSTTA